MIALAPSSPPPAPAQFPTTLVLADPAPAFAPLIVLAVIGIVIVAAVFGHRQAKARREALAALADELGLAFSPARDRDHDEQYAHFEMFRRGHSRSAWNTLSGTATLAGHPCRVKLGDFTYKVTRHNGKTTTTTTHNFSYLIAHLPFRSVPDLLIRPEHLFDKIGGVFSDKDIDFESDDFSRRFFVASPDRRFAYAVCHPRMMEFFLSTSPPAVDIEHGRLCLAEGARRWSPDQFREQFAWLDAFLTRWPDHVVADLTAPHRA